MIINHHSKVHVILSISQEKEETMKCIIKFSREDGKQSCHKEKENYKNCRMFWVTMLVE